MRKLLCLAVIVTAAIPVWADDNAPAAVWGRVDKAERVADSNIAHNFLFNGGFDDPAFEQRTINGYDGMDVAYECTALPGWAIETASLRNGMVEVVRHNGSEDNPQYVRFYHYTLDGWARITLTASVSGLTPGHEYVLDMYVCHSYIESNYWANPDHGFKIYGKDGELMHFNHSISSGAEWEYLRYSFTPTDDQISLELWSQNYNGDGWKSGPHTVSWDQLRIYDPDSNGLSSIETDQLPSQIYTVQGIPVNGHYPLHGLYLIKRGSKVTKIFLQ